MKINTTAMALMLSMMHGYNGNIFNRKRANPQKAQRSQELSEYLKSAAEAKRQRKAYKLHVDAAKRDHGYFLAKANSFHCFRMVAA